jgi:hypothetical protein
MLHRFTSTICGAHNVYVELVSTAPSNAESGVTDMAGAWGLKAERVVPQIAY